MSELGDLLRKLRGDRSLREVAQITDLSHTYISDVEKGFRRASGKPLNPSPEILKRLADAYGYPYEKLMETAGYLDTSFDTQSSQSEKDEAEFQAFINDPELEMWYKELPKSEEEELRKLRTIWEMIKNEQK